MGYSYVNFAIPNLSPGIVIEYKYILVSSNLIELKEWYFQHDIPALYSRLQVFSSKELNYIYLFQGSENIRKRADVTYICHDISEVKIKDGEYEMWDVPVVHSETYMTSYNDYRARIRFQLQQVLGVEGEGSMLEKYYVRQNIITS